jgi:fructose-bisphosphate aldolase class II
MIVPSRVLFEHAYGKYAVGAYNINNMEQAMGLFQGAMDSQAPFIVQISRGARSYTHKLMLEGVLRAADQIFPDALFSVHLDHGDEESCMDAIASGFYSSVMIDASMFPFDENVAKTKRVVEAAHAKGISVEAEIGTLGGVEEDIAHDAKDAHLTDPQEALDFYNQTGCDSLACAIGTSHGAFKFAGGQAVHLDRIKAIAAVLPARMPIVMHGSSSVPQDEVERINAAGGKLEGAKGVDPAQYFPAAQLGVCKINIDTDGRLVWCRVHREYFVQHPEEFDPRGPGKVYMSEYAKFIAGRNEYLGSKGQLDGSRAHAKQALGLA